MYLHIVKYIIYFYDFQTFYSNTIANGAIIILYFYDFYIQLAYLCSEDNYAQFRLTNEHKNQNNFQNHRSCSPRC